MTPVLSVSRNPAGSLPAPWGAAEMRPAPIRSLSTMVIVVLGCNTEPGNPEVTLQDRIVFMGDITSKRIVHMRPDGTDRIEIPAAIPNDFARDLEVSPDGRQVLFAAQSLGGDDIFVVNADG